MIEVHKPNNARIFYKQSIRRRLVKQMMGLELGNDRNRMRYIARAVEYLMEHDITSGFYLRTTKNIYHYVLYNHVLVLRPYKYVSGYGSLALVLVAGKND